MLFRSKIKKEKEKERLQGYKATTTYLISAVTFLTFKVKVEVSECINLTINRKLKRWGKKE